MNKCKYAETSSKMNKYLLIKYLRKTSTNKFSREL